MTQQYLKTIDIIFDTPRKEEQVSLFKKLINSFCTKKKRPTTKVMDNIRKLYKTVKSDDINPFSVVRINNLFEHEFFNVLTTNKVRSEKQLYLMRDFEQLIKLLSSFVEEPKEDNYEIEVIVEIPRPKRLKKVTTYEKITILERWVKIGYKMYRRNFNVWTGDSYIVVDGDVYDIKTDRYGREYLA